MNEILSLTGKRFGQKKRSSNGGGSASLPKNSKVTLKHLENLLTGLQQVNHFWENESLISGVLINVRYRQIIAKSNRLTEYFKTTKISSNDTIVGARFNKNRNKHIVTHYISKEALSSTLKKLEATISVFINEGLDSITDIQFADKKFFDGFLFNKIKKTSFKNIVRDSWFVENFEVDNKKIELHGSSIVTLYDTNSDVKSILNKLNIVVTDDHIVDKTTVLLDEQYAKILLDKAPFLVSMAVEDLNTLAIDDVQDNIQSSMFTIDAPGNQPTIGVLDTMFDNRVYFSEWVDFHDEISNQITKEPKDYQHGTAVSSLIVDGARLNPNLNDGLGNFKVRHFGVSLASGFNSFAIIKTIRRIIETNQDIKVWNLSLGSNDSIRDNFISAEGAVLDELQYEYDVIFVIAGTNQFSKMPNNIRQKIGAPADSLNSLIVNSVDSKNQPVSFSRQGIVLSFFTKPDVSYYGGGNGEYVNVVEPLGKFSVAGTSYAAPLVARKLSYLIDIMGLTREVAKALIIDSSIGWNQNKSFDYLSLVGNGVVPISMEDILSSSEDEIKFMISDVSEKYDSYNYNFPVPIKDDEFPYVAKATMVYFPKTSRTQGVDYTNTELNIKFGRLKNVTSGDPIEPINNDNQNIDDGLPHYLYEAEARKNFRKWDNVKHIGEKFTLRKHSKPILNFQNPQWGMSVKTTERLSPNDGQNIKFGVVITLKAIDGINRIEDFISSAELRGWLVNKLHVQNQVKVYNQLTEDIDFD